MDELESASSGLLGTEVASHIADLRENRSDRAAICLDAVTCMVEHASQHDLVPITSRGGLSHPRWKFFATRAWPFAGFLIYSLASDQIRGLLELCPEAGQGTLTERESFSSALVEGIAWALET